MNRQIPAMLIFRLDNGKQFEATADDLERFGLVERTACLSKLRRIIVDGLTESRAGKEGGDFQLQPIILCWTRPPTQSKTWPTTK